MNTRIYIIIYYMYKHGTIICLGNSLKSVNDYSGIFMNILHPLLQYPYALTSNNAGATRQMNTPERSNHHFWSPRGPES